MKKKLVLLFSVIFLFSILSSWIFYEQKVRRIEAKAVKILRQRLESCDVIRHDISFLSEEGKLWLICNSRPFYAEYKNGNLSYELNGWGFLKSQESWNELKDCDFYYPENSYLVFFCPGFNLKGVKEIKAKYYEFDEDSFRLTKIKEEDFGRVLKNDIIRAYPFLDECKLENFTGWGGGNYSKPVFTLYFSCKDYEYIVYTNLEIIFPPVPSELTNKSISTAFFKSFGVFPNLTRSNPWLGEGFGVAFYGEKPVGRVVALANFEFGVLAIDYNTSTTGYPNFLIEGEPEKVVRLAGDKFIPEFEKIEELEMVGGRRISRFTVNSYSTGKSILNLYLLGDEIWYMERKRDGFYEI